MPTPLRYDPSFEHVADDEAETIQGIVDRMHEIAAKTFEDSGHANRSVHAKAHALLTGEMIVRDAPVDLSGKPDGLREALSAFFAGEGGEWDLRVQLCTDRETMPVEDATVQWPEDESPHVPVARIRVGPQPSYDESRHQKLDEGMAFSPWFGIEAHRPLGSVMRARKPAYEMSSAFRAEANGCPIHQPRSAADVAV